MTEDIIKPELRRASHVTFPFILKDTLMGPTMHHDLEHTFEAMNQRWCVIGGKLYSRLRRRFVSLQEAKLEEAKHTYALKTSTRPDLMDLKIKSIFEEWLRYYNRTEYRDITFDPRLIGQISNEQNDLNFAHHPWTCQSTPLPAVTDKDVEPYLQALQVIFKNNPDLVEVWHSSLWELFRSPTSTPVTWHFHSEQHSLIQVLANVVRLLADPYTCSVDHSMSLLRKQDACFAKLVVIRLHVDSRARANEEIFSAWLAQASHQFEPKYGFPMYLDRYLRQIHLHLAEATMPDVSRLDCAYSFDRSTGTNALMDAVLALSKWLENTLHRQQLFAWYFQQPGRSSSIELWSKIIAS